jgi:large repetitive protein
VFDDLDIPLGDQLTIEFDNAVDNTNPTLLTGVLAGATLTLVFDPSPSGQRGIDRPRQGIWPDRRSVRRSRSEIMASPVAVDDTVSTLQNEPVEIAVYENDFDPDGVVVPDSVQIVPDSGPYSGTVTLHSGVFTYTPAANFFGSDSFRYTIRDNDGWVSNEALVTITVTQVPPYHNPVFPTMSTIQGACRPSTY